jgi:hypothetical protein
MKLKELLEGSINTYTGPRTNWSRGWKDFSPEEIQEALEKVFKSDEYKEVIALAPMVSSKTELAHGLLSFEIKKDLLYYDVNVQGNIRYKSREEPQYVYTRGLLKSALVNNDASLYSRYIENLKEIIKKLKDKQSQKSKSFSNSEYKEIIKSLTDLDLSNVTNSLSITAGYLTSLEGCPEKLNNLRIISNKEILSLHGCPIRIENNIDFNNSKIKDIDFLPQKIGNQLSLTRTDITSLAGIGRKFVRSCKYLEITENDLNSSILGILLIQKLESFRFYSKSVDYLKVSTIINKHLKGERDLISCKEELMAAGFKELAKL